LWVTPVASRISKIKKMKERGGKVDSRPNIWSYDSSLSHVKLTRFVNGIHSRRIAEAQYCSSCEAPMTTAMLVVAGASRRISSTISGKSNDSPTKAALRSSASGGNRRRSIPV
jgi:hypothetical protein